ncbi:hypothetical protein SUDANB135_00173 [Streptomyces sp. SudanB135_2055]|uniref:hypothetical protein n=1 Tax=Streptomyces sp. SudanB135_2055 TaxID=3035279 RepID=UPI0036D925B6
MRTPFTARAWAVPAAAVVAIGLLSGCGGSDDSSAKVATVSSGAATAGNGAGSAGSGDTSNVKQAQKFVDCMRKNGVEMEDPDPQTGELNFQDLTGGGAKSTEMSKAMDVCRDKMPQSMQDQKDNIDQESLQKFATCMRKNGVDVADPGPDGLDRDSMNQDDPDFQKAMDACRDNLGARSGGSW